MAYVPVGDKKETTQATFVYRVWCRVKGHCVGPLIQRREYAGKWF